MHMYMEMKNLIHVSQVSTPTLYFSNNKDTNLRYPPPDLSFDCNSIASGGANKTKREKS